MSTIQDVDLDRFIKEIEPIVSHFKLVDRWINTKTSDDLTDDYLEWFEESLKIITLEAIKRSTPESIYAAFKSSISEDSYLNDHSSQDVFLNMFSRLDIEKQNDLRQIWLETIESRKTIHS